MFRVWEAAPPLPPTEPNPNRFNQTQPTPPNPTNQLNATQPKPKSTQPTQPNPANPTQRRSTQRKVLFLNKYCSKKYGHTRTIIICFDTEFTKNGFLQNGLFFNHMITVRGPQTMFVGNWARQVGQNGTVTGVPFGSACHWQG